MADCENDRSHKATAFIKSHGIDLIVSLVPVASMLLWVLARPIYLAGRINSGFLFFLAEMFYMFMVMSSIGACIWLVLHLVARLVCRRFKLAFGCSVFLCIVICASACEISLSRLMSHHFGFEYGFRQWVLRNADLEAMRSWRTALASDETSLPKDIHPDHWPDFIALLSPESVSCERFEPGCVDLVLRWTGGLRHVYGLTVRPKDAEPYNPPWRCASMLKVSPGVYVWWRW
jgi:hypothetical protein